MLYYMVSKKHLRERIVPLRVPFAGVACPKVHVRTANAEIIWGHVKNRKGSSLVHRPNIPLRTLAFGFTQSEVHIRFSRKKNSKGCPLSPLAKKREPWGKPKEP